MTDQPINPHGIVFVADLHPREWALYMAGRFDGHLEGLDEGRCEAARDAWRAGWIQGHHDGWAAADAHAAALHAIAHRHVQALARLDPHQVTELKSRIRTLEAALRNHEERRPLHSLPRPGAAA
jgi:hypothetical protein